MTTLAKDAQIDTYYRLTRDPGTSYYMICRPGAVTKLEKRVANKNPLQLSADDRRLAQALKLCREKEHVLALRGTRYLDEKGNRREMRAYVAFPPDYPLRAVSRLPAYAPKRKRDDGAQTTTEEQEGEPDGSPETSDQRQEAG